GCAWSSIPASFTATTAFTAARSTTPSGCSTPTNCATACASIPQWPLGLMVSHEIYDGVVRHAYGDIDPHSYAPMTIHLKHRDVAAWVHHPTETSTEKENPCGARQFFPYQHETGQASSGRRRAGYPGLTV